MVDPLPAYSPNRRSSWEARRWSRRGPILAMAVVLAGCGGQRLGLPSVPPTPPPQTSAPAIVAGGTTAGSTPITPAPAGSQPSATSVTWNNPVLTITPNSLGAVRVGMTLPEAQYAAGVSLGNFGDGFASASPTGNPVLFVGGGVGIPSAPGKVGCVGASLDTSRASRQVVVTPEGVRLGDPASRVPAVYGSTAHFVPAPTSGINPVAGYVVNEAAGNVAFVVTNGTLTEIEGGDPSLNPSSCTG